MNIAVPCGKVGGRKYSRSMAPDELIALAERPRACRREVSNA